MKTLKNKFASTPVKIQLRAKNQDTVALPETKTDIQKKEALKKSHNNKMIYFILIKMYKNFFEKYLSSLNIQALYIERIAIQAASY